MRRHQRHQPAICELYLNFHKKNVSVCVYSEQQMTNRVLKLAG